MEHISRLQLWQLVDGELPANETTIFKAHMLSCSVCRKEYEILMEIETKMHGVSSPEPGEGFALKVTGRVIEKRNEAVTPAKKIFLITLVLSVMLCFVLVLILLQKNDGSPGIFKYFDTIDLAWITWVSECIGILLLLFFFDQFFFRKKYLSKTM